MRTLIDSIICEWKKNRGVAKFVPNLYYLQFVIPHNNKNDVSTTICYKKTKRPQLTSVFGVLTPLWQSLEVAAPLVFSLRFTLPSLLLNTPLTIVDEKSSYCIFFISDPENCFIMFFCRHVLLEKMNISMKY